jgi:uncharacterized protein (DUF427 family)
VWDYPRPPVIRASDEQIVVVLGGVEICETNTSLRVLETSHPPTYYLPRSAFIDGALIPARGTTPLNPRGGEAPAHGHTFCEWKGEASYLDVVGGDKVATRAAWYYPQPNPAYAALRGHVAVYPGAMDRCLVDGELVEPQPGGFYGGWITSAVTGPFKGIPGSRGW